MVYLSDALLLSPSLDLPLLQTQRMKLSRPHPPPSLELNKPDTSNSGIQDLQHRNSKAQKIHLTL